MERTSPNSRQFPRWILLPVLSILITVFIAWLAIAQNQKQTAGQLAAQQTMFAQTAQIADTALANEQATATAARATVNVERAGTAEAFVNATQTAQSVSTTATAQAALNMATTATAQSLALTQAAESGQECTSASDYAFVFVPEGGAPRLEPTPGVALILGQYDNDAARAFATWTLQITETTVACPWKTLSLVTSSGEALMLANFYIRRLDRENAVINPLPTATPAKDATESPGEKIIVFPEDNPLVVGEMIELTIGFFLPPRTIDKVWVLEVNGVVLVDASYRLKLKVDNWITILNPPTQTPKPTKEPAPDAQDRPPMTP